MNIDYHSIGKRIKICRNNSHITQEQLAYRINSAPSYISNIERGIKKPSLEKLIQIADALGVTVNDFIYNASESYTPYDIHELSSIISECSPDKKKVLLGSITTIIQAFK